MERNNHSHAIKRKECVEEETQRRKDLLIRGINASLNELKRFSTQIFMYKGSKLTQVGSGFYFRCGERLFLVSAAHVFDDDPENIRYVFDDNGEIQKLIGTFHKHKSNTKRDDDLKDVIAVELDRAIKSEAVGIEMIDLQPSYQEGIYAFIGYPGTTNGAIYGKREMKNRSYSYFDMSRPASEIASFSYDDSLNIMIRYQHKKTISNGVGPSKGAKMKGISGGPVFRVSQMADLSKWNKERIKLAGIVIHTVERHEYMAAVRFKVLIDYFKGDQNLLREFESFQIDD